MDYDYAVPDSVPIKSLALIFEKPLILKFIKSNVKQYRLAVNRKSFHMKFWNETFELIHNLTFEGAKRPPLVQDGWLFTISAVRSLWLALRKKGIQELYTRVLSNDALDNLFASIRAVCGDKNKPTAQEFINSLKVQIINNSFCKERHRANCKEDDSRLLSNLQTFLNVELVQISSTETDTNDICLDNSTQIVNQIVEAIFSNSLIALSVVNLSTVIARTILTKIGCYKYTNILTFEAPLSSSESKTAPQEPSDKQSTQINPSEQFIITMGCCMTLIGQLLPNKLQDIGIRKKIVTILNELIDFSWMDCTLHSSTVKKCTIGTVCWASTVWYCKYLIQDSKKPITVSRRKVQRKPHTVQH